MNVAETNDGRSAKERGARTVRLRRGEGRNGEGRKSMVEGQGSMVRARRRWPEGPGTPIERRRSEMTLGCPRPKTRNLRDFRLAPEGPSWVATGAAATGASPETRNPGETTSPNPHSATPGAEESRFARDACISRQWQRRGHWGWPHAPLRRGGSSAQLEQPASGNLPTTVGANRRPSLHFIRGRRPWCRWADCQAAQAYRVFTTGCPAGSAA